MDSPFPMMVSILANCLSVMHNMETNPLTGTMLRTRLLCTSALSMLGQQRIYTEYWYIVKPSSMRAVRNRAYFFRSILVWVGRSKKTISPIIRYSLRRSCMGDSILFFKSLRGIPEGPRYAFRRKNRRRVRRWSVTPPPLADSVCRK